MTGIRAESTSTFRFLSLASSALLDAVSMASSSFAVQC